MNELHIYILQSYKQHKFEPDPERVNEIIAKSIEDAKWIINKVLITFNLRNAMTHSEYLFPITVCR